MVIAGIFTNLSSPFLDGIRESTVTLFCLNSSLNPILYFWKIKAVKQEVHVNNDQTNFVFVKLIWSRISELCYLAQIIITNPH